MIDQQRLRVKRGDSAPDFRARCLGTQLDEQGRERLAPVELAGAGVKVLFRPVGDTGVAFTLTGTAEAGGWVRAPWGSNLSTVATYEGEVEVTYSGGAVQTFPAGGYFTLEVVADLG